MAVSIIDAKGFSNNPEEFKKIYQSAQHVVVLTGAGVSAESGIPTFRDAGGLWKTFRAQDLATPDAFANDPSLVWEFYQYRRETVLNKKPNPGHYALAECERRLVKNGKKFALITQNIDGYHKTAGTENLIEMHGNLFRTRCTKCLDVQENRTPVIYKKKENAAEDDGLPKYDLLIHSTVIILYFCGRCKKCEGLLRPDVVWFSESLDPEVMKKAQDELSKCDLFIIAGTSGTVYPAALFSITVSLRKVPIAEFNIDEIPPSSFVSFYFRGSSGELLPKYLLGDDPKNKVMSKHMAKMLEGMSLKESNSSPSTSKAKSGSSKSPRRRKSIVQPRLTRAKSRSTSPRKTPSSQKKSAEMKNPVKK